MGHVPQHNAIMFETVSSVGARQGPIITVQEGHTFLAILILFKKILCFLLWLFFSPLALKRQYMENGWIKLTLSGRKVIRYYIIIAIIHSICDLGNFI